ncbi:MAG: PepSY-associated TM helix domain-containing protein [Bacteroidales bacterium]|nr:PepSY-associated TM helix domain-containing protein [Bacteroidales bacterium]
MNFRKLNRNVHRDLGYIFFYLTIIYGLSGIALNHIDDWNPSYVIKSNVVIIKTAPLEKENLSRINVISLLEEIAPEEKYKNHYFQNDSTLKVFIKDGNVIINLESGQGNIETSKRRPVLHQYNYLHYNPRKWWTAISDIYAISLMLLAITGLFILKGKNGITGRGAWLTTLGIIVPVIFLLLYYWKVF